MLWMEHEWGLGTVPSRRLAEEADGSFGEFLNPLPVPEVLGPEPV